MFFMADPARLVFGKEIFRLASDYQFAVFNADTKCCGLEGFGDYYPDREYGFGIAEQNYLAAAAGYAHTSNEKVIVSTFAVFASMRACEQIRSFVCYPKANVTIVATHAGLTTAEDGASHIAVEDLSIMRALPNLTILAPSDNVAAIAAARIAVEFSGPLYIRFPKAATPNIHEQGKYRLRLGEIVIIKEFGYDVSLFASGSMLFSTLQAAEILLLRGVKAVVAEVHTVKPLDRAMVFRLAKKTNAAVTVEDNTIIGGLGSAVVETLAECYPIPVQRIGIKDAYGESGKSVELYQKHGMLPEDIANAAMQAIEMKGMREN
jgi:transketolase